MTNNSFVEINEYSFSKNITKQLELNHHANNHWPLVYILSGKSKSSAYVGETTRALRRMEDHLKDEFKQKLISAHIISSDKFNKSATLDVESRLIQFMAADGQFKLLNSNLGLTNHNYYQRRELYNKLFSEVWDSLKRKKLVKHSIKEIENSDLFKYSPYKCLSNDQRQNLVAILTGLASGSTRSLVVQGGAGTGKSVLAIYLFKLLLMENSHVGFKELGSEQAEIYRLVQKVKEKYPTPKMALVVPVSSFRKTLQKAFRNVSDLKSNMVIGPAQLSREKYDIVLVDEAHRLRRPVNLGTYSNAFKKASNRLGLNETTSNELDWVLMQSQKSVLFYDKDQTVRPIDIQHSSFQKVLASPNNEQLILKSQFRTRGGNDYVDFVHKLLNNSLGKSKLFSDRSYELKLYDSLPDMVSAIKAKNEEYGLSRMVAGFAWPWVSKKGPNLYDIEIDGFKLKWNNKTEDWVNSENAVNEVGCIHTTQGYDLNYTGIIFGTEITYDKRLDQIVIKKENYHDKAGKATVTDPNELKAFIINVYRTIMLRGIHGTFVYICDKPLRDYFAKYLSVQALAEVTELHSKQVQEKIPYQNSVPYISLEAAAGNFSDQQTAKHIEWVRVPEKFATKDYFACKVVGESMNKEIANGSICLFRYDQGGSRNGKTVLVERSDCIDQDSGSFYTVKKYSSTKVANADNWRHQAISLIPNSDDASFKTIELVESNKDNFRIVGIFVCELSE